jgi:hypothetical protein
MDYNPTEEQVEEAFVVKYAASGHILHFKGGFKVTDGYLEAGRCGYFRRGQWFKTLPEAEAEYERLVKNAIKNKQKQLETLRKRLVAPTIEVRVRNDVE